MKNKIEVAIVLNEKQATVMFSTLKDQTDMNCMFLIKDLKTNDGLFHEWYPNFFRYCWNHSKSFEQKIKV